MWQSLVTIGQATLEIKWRKKEDLNYSSKTEWPAASLCWRAAVVSGLNEN